MSRNVRNAFFAATVAAGVLAPVGFSPAHAQDIVPDANRGVPQDWSHRHVIIRNAETMQEASSKGAVAFERWKERLKDPRYTMAVARKTIFAQQTTIQPYSGQQLAYNSRWGGKRASSPIKRDWSVALGAATAVDGSGTGTGVGTQGMFPAKYTWDLNATPSCANDFIVHSTMTPGATSGTSAKQNISFVAFRNVNGFDTPFTNVDNGNGTITITNGANSITLKGSTTASVAANSGLNFYMGAAASSNSPAYYAYNLAAAINRNGNAVGVSATSLGGVVTVIANAVGTGGNSIALSKNVLFTNVTLGGATLTGGADSGVQPTLVAYNQLYKTTCTTGTGAVTNGSPNIYWSYNTGTGAIVETSPALSLDGTQVSFVQRTMTAAGPTASLVLLKWAAGTAGAHAATVAPTEVTNANYRSCTAPCMTKFALGANNQNSAPYVDYTNDRIYVGDAIGRLHRFDGVFQGTPSAAASWPVTVSTGNMLSSPVYDSASDQVFVGTDVSEVGAPQTGGVFARVDASNRTVVSSGNIGAYTTDVTGENVKMMGVRDGAIVDSLAQRAYVFLESDTTTTCGGVTNCKAVYQFTTSFAASNLGTATQLGRGQIPGRVLYVGQFDDAYWSSTPTSPTGNLYACGSVDGGNSRAPTLWRIPITNNVMGTAVPVLTFTSGPRIGEVGATCSPITTIKNGANEYLYAGVTAIGNTPQCSGACIYMVKLNAPLAAGPAYDRTSASSTIGTTIRYMSLASTVALNTNEGAVQTTVPSPANFVTMTITQTAANPAGATTTYILRKNGADADPSLSCSVPPFGSTCTASGLIGYATGDFITVSVQRTGGIGNLNSRTVRVQLTGSPQPTAGLAATGGTSGIVVDNISAQPGTSQVYFSTLGRAGRAIQASQAGLN